jgi:hypothetical protein
MDKRWTVLIAGISFGLASCPSVAEESSRYLGRKLEYVLQHVDNRYVERNKEELTTRHRKAFRDLRDHLLKNYPTLEMDLLQWLNEHYAAHVAEIPETDPKQKKHTLDVLLTIDRDDPRFRGKLLAYLEERYPRLYGDIACFLRDKHPACLREVLRLTFRMTSHVKPFSLDSHAGAAETDVQAQDPQLDLMPEGK